ncbi:class I SAM-dependent methyltransferase [Methanofollis fontis]|uniref:Class I SAM-dependent methyltransferase n=1 Tax=Methanofollis fontis TaxID=2052832 RepID=A0A483CVP9_9EURY|nr:class I SAM-dependent methyltransferase [Methanofollis fontis]TAJ45756.1 class I SAM-dependent methyltransferase [Methanofollis fontis]
MHRIIDWEELWKAIYAGGSGRRKKDRDPGAAWDAKAAAYECAVRGEADTTAREMEMMGLLPSDTVLDMGAGTGRLAVPMARRVAHVTALDPSEGMLGRLSAHMQEAGLDNYTLLRMRWEDAIIGENVPVHDTVVAAYSLGFYDIGTALKKIDAAARRCVCLFWHAGEWRSGDETALREAAFGTEERHAGYPDHLFLINILHDMEIYADVTVYETTVESRYPSVEVAAEQWSTLHETPPETLDLVTDHFTRMLHPDGEGGYIHRKQRRQAMIHWEKEA